MNKNIFKKNITQGLKKMELHNSDKLMDRLWIYMNFLMEENNKYNLTAIEKEEEIVTKHFLDSLVFFTKYNIKDGIRILDIGTGAGFPGLVLKIYRTDINMVLLDSLNKRINFLNILSKKLGLINIKSIHGRAEELAYDQEYREKFDFVVSRAVAPINVLSEYTIPFIFQGGKVVFFKGPDYQKEIEEGQKAIETLGGKITNIHKVNIPNIEGNRFLLEVEKVKETPGKYPRRPGIPKKRPL